MKKRFAKFAVLLSIASVAYTQNSSADSIVDLITYSPSKTISHNNEFTDTFNITTFGFTVGTDTVTGGKAIFDLSAGSGNQGNYKVTIDLDTLAVVNNGGLQDYTFTLGSGSIGSLNADGMLSFTLFQNNGSVNYILNSAELDVDYTAGTKNPNSQTQPVPDGSSTAILLGSACLAILFLRSRANSAAVKAQ